MERKWTPGPWEVDDAGDVHSKHLGYAYSFVAISTGEDYGGYYGDNADVDLQKKANAHLIAAAPDLYEALENLLNDPGDDYIKTRHWDAARAALAKARGDTG
jgi:hypothetical protein